MTPSRTRVLFFFTFVAFLFQGSFLSAQQQAVPQAFTAIPAEANSILRVDWQALQANEDLEPVARRLRLIAPGDILRQESVGGLEALAEDFPGEIAAVETARFLPPQDGARPIHFLVVQGITESQALLQRLKKAGWIDFDQYDGYAIRRAPGWDGYLTPLGEQGFLASNSHEGLTRMIDAMKGREASVVSPRGRMSTLANGANDAIAFAAVAIDERDRSEIRAQSLELEPFFDASSGFQMLISEVGGLRQTALRLNAAPQGLITSLAFEFQDSITAARATEALNGLLPQAASAAETLARGSSENRELVRLSQLQFRANGSWTTTQLGVPYDSLEEWVDLARRASSAAESSLASRERFTGLGSAGSQEATYAARFQANR